MTTNVNLAKYLKGCYGSEVKPSEVKRWLIDNIMANAKRDRRITLNIWSAPGVGKTSIVKSLEKIPVDWNGKHYDGFEVVDIPLAQIEEMGDILGFPVEEILLTKDKEEKWIKAVDSLISKHMKEGWEPTERQRTQYAPPAWVPKEAKPGVLLFDDGNRASQRIMKGLMQLVQDYRTISWSIPAGWTIVFTGNPDNRTNQVTGMDTAQLTRMKHITLQPDAHEWIKWAEGQKDSDGMPLIDGRLISYIGKYPEMMIGKERTNPRSLEEFGRALTQFPKLEGDALRLCTIEANASLDEETVASLMSFLVHEAEFILEPMQILNGKVDIPSTIKEYMNRTEPRIDVINIITERLYATLISNTYKFENKHVKNLQAWLTCDGLPKDLAHFFMKRLMKENEELARKFAYRNQALTALLQL